MINLEAPDEFLAVCRELLVDPAILTELDVTIPRYALFKIKQADAPIIIDFIDQLLSGGYAPEEYLDWWSTMPVGFGPFVGDGVIRILRELRQELDLPRYFP